MTGRRARRSILSVALALTVSLGAISLSGCAAPDSGYDPDAAKQLQSEVLAVSELAATTEFASALLALAELDASLKDARARDLITEERYASIVTASALVRADLEAAIAAQTPPEPEPEPEPDVEEEDEGKKGKDKPGPKEKDDKGNKGKGKGKGKGKP